MQTLVWTKSFIFHDLTIIVRITKAQSSTHSLKSQSPILWWNHQAITFPAKDGRSWASSLMGNFIFEGRPFSFMTSLFKSSSFSVETFLVVMLVIFQGYGAFHLLSTVLGIVCAGPHVCRGTWALHRGNWGRRTRTNNLRLLSPGKL